MNRRSVLAASGMLYGGATAGCLETLTGGRLSDAIGQSERTRREGEVIEAYNDAIFYREEMRTMFQHGRITLRDRARGEHIFWNIVARIARYGTCSLRYHSCITGSMV